MANLNLSLLQNACDFLSDTINRATSKDKFTWKYAVLSLASALELIMKSVLYEEHWCLLFDNVDSASEDALKSGRFKSIDFETAQSRLEALAGVVLSERDKGYLRSIRDTRNRITHSQVDINIEQVKALVARGILVFLDLYKDPHLEDSYDEGFASNANRSLLQFEKYLQLRMATIKQEIEGASRPASPFRWCRTCGQDAVVCVGHEEGKCLYCQEEIDIRAVARRGSEMPLEECPQCGRESLAFILYNNDDGEFGCASCGFTTSYLNRA